MRSALLTPVLAATAMAAVLASGPARAEVSEVRVAQQFGISYLPLDVMRHQKLIVKHAAKMGIKDLKVSWLRFGAGNAMNEALLSGNLDFPAAGVGPLLTIWSKTKGHQNVKGIAALNSMPLYLNTTNPNVKTVKDFTSKDRIALPAVKVSIQAVTLQMAAAQAFGEEHYNKLDPLTVSMKHPDALAALLSGKSEIDSHLTSPPYQQQELQDPRVHRVFSSFDVLGGPTTFNSIYTTQKFHDANPKICAAFLAALEEATKFITDNHKEAVQIYIEEEHSKLKPEFLLKILADPDNVYTTRPQNIMKYATFMKKVGDIDIAPKDWKEVFFPEIHGAAGS